MHSDEKFRRTLLSVYVTLTAGTDPGFYKGGSLNFAEFFRKKHKLVKFI